MKTLILIAIVCPAEYDVELTHLSGPVLGQEALHEKAIAVADLVILNVQHQHHIRVGLD